MAFKITLKDWISIFVSKQHSESTLSIQPNKKFSDVKEYIETGKFGKSILGRVTRQTDDGITYRYEYDCGGDGRNIYRVTVKHRGEKVDLLELYKRCEAALAISKGNLNDFEKKVPDIPEGEAVVAEVVPTEDYSTKNLNELVDIFDKKFTSFVKTPTLDKVEEICTIKNAMNDQVNLMPLAERAPFAKAIGDMTPYIDALKMQLGSPLANASQFVGVYAPKIQSALSELAALLN